MLLGVLIASVFAANPERYAGRDATRAGDALFDERADAFAVDLRERVERQDPGLGVLRQRRPGVVARQTERHLRQVVRLPAGTAVVVEAAEQLPDKKTRYLLVEPVVGWVSRGAVAKAR